MPAASDNQNFAEWNFLLSVRRIAADSPDTGRAVSKTCSAICEIIFVELDTCCLYCVQRLLVVSEQVSRR